MRRLKTHSQFRAVLDGPRIASTAHFALHQCDLTNVGLRPAPTLAHDDGIEAPDPASPQGPVMGAMVPKRWAKRAVTRNMIKRQIYNVGATFGSDLSSAAYVVRLRAGFDRQRFVSASSVALKNLVREELIALFSHPQARRGGVAGALARQP